MRKIFEAELERVRREIPVKVLIYKDLLKYINDSDVNGTAGAFYPKKFFIFVYKNMPYYVKLWVLLHEYGHYLCWENKCYCLRRYFARKKETISQYACEEYHAHRYALKYLRKKGYKRSEQDCIRLIKSIKKAGKHGEEREAFRLVHKKAVRAKLIRR